jgi:hypothetical protein
VAGLRAAVRGVSFDESAYFRKLQKKRKTRAGGRPRKKAARCACGLMTYARAVARYHKCKLPKKRK